MRRQGKYQKQAGRDMKVYLILAVAVVVLGISLIVVYKAGEKSAIRSQESENHLSMTIQEAVVETSQLAVSITETTIEATEATEETTLPTTKPTQPTEATQPETESTKPVTRTGTVLRSAGELNVRSGAGTNYSAIGRLTGGEEVTIYEEKTVGDTVWGNIGYGWVSMDYIVFGADTSADPTYAGSAIRKDDYFGDWLSSDGKCYMCITQNGNGADIRVVSTISQGVDMTWSMYGEFDEHGVIRYWNGVCKDHNAGVESVKYTNGEGAIVIEGLSLSWHESAEGPGEAGRFERVYNYSPNGSNGNQNFPSQDNGTTNVTEIPRRFGSDDIKMVLERETKIQLGYRYGDEFTMNTPAVSNYDATKGEYSVMANGKWCGSSFYISAVLQDINGVLSLARVFTFNVK